MTTMNISLPENLKEFVDIRVQDGGYSTSSEYVRELIRKDQTRLGECIAVLVQEALDSGPAVPVDARYWQDKREAFIKRHKSQ